MKFRDLPIKTKIVRMILLTTCAVLFVTCTAYFSYEFFSFRKTTMLQLSTLAKIISANSTAALAFDDQAGAQEILSAVGADPHIVSAILFDADGKLFTHYPADGPTPDLSRTHMPDGYYFEQSHVVGFEPVVLQDRRLGTLYLKSDMGAIYERLTLYSIIALIMATVSLLLAYGLSRNMQKHITWPVLALARTAESISLENNYSMRANKVSADEIGVLTDAFNLMVDRIQAQTEEITSLNQNLEEKIKERTHALQAANKELEAFSYSVSHDLRAPLRSIHGYMNIFMEEYGHLLDDEGKRLVNISISNGQRMGQLIDELLAFSRLGRQSLRKSEIPMKEVVETVWREQCQIDGPREITFKLHELPPARADGVAIKQVWTNLISNARKYTLNQPAPRIEVGWRKSEDDVVYYVADNGAGFDMQYYNKLFGVFQRLHSQDEFEGTGVGLAIVQRIITKHGGRIWATGEPDKGATFYFSLSAPQQVEV